ncbi:hypothetical protein WOLCODRAFT_139938 [Wolfiporia cocos MD-104 SS10]|uniref:Uncharacterized protein n=1 Tax=Wolfiporia cocos (strain MD-104) TaxID=742152 RepID=A0A2H3J9Y3_WOLCO|nr:hypothetical protein WOLCODRAFT_139938 [Wolfiporia cocos MD-104 SS10]
MRLTVRDRRIDRRRLLHPRHGLRVPQECIPACRAGVRDEQLHRNGGRERDEHPRRRLCRSIFDCFVRVRVCLVAFGACLVVGRRDLDSVAIGDVFRRRVFTFSFSVINFIRVVHIFFFVNIGVFFVFRSVLFSIGNVFRVVHVFCECVVFVCFGHVLGRVIICVFIGIIIGICILIGIGLGVLYGLHVVLYGLRAVLRTFLRFGIVLLRACLERKRLSPELGPALRHTHRHRDRERLRLHLRLPVNLGDHPLVRRARVHRLGSAHHARDDARAQQPLAPDQRVLVRGVIDDHAALVDRRRHRAAAGDDDDVRRRARALGRGRAGGRRRVRGRRARDVSGVSVPAGTWGRGERLLPRACQTRSCLCLCLWRVRGLAVAVAVAGADLYGSYGLV